MKINNVLLVVCTMIGATQYCNGQQQEIKHQPQASPFKVTSQPQPLVILKSDTRTLRLDPQENEIFDLESVDPKHVKSITVLKGEDARNAYGESAVDGVLVVQLVDDFIFSKPALIKLKLEN